MLSVFGILLYFASFGSLGCCDSMTCRLIGISDACHSIVVIACYYLIMLPGLSIHKASIDALMFTFFVLYILCL